MGMSENIFFFGLFRAILVLLPGSGTPGYATGCMQQVGGMGTVKNVLTTDIIILFSLGMREFLTGSDNWACQR